MTVDNEDFRRRRMAEKAERAGSEAVGTGLEHRDQIALLIDLGMAVWRPNVSRGVHSGPTIDAGARSGSSMRVAATIG